MEPASVEEERSHGLLVRFDYLSPGDNSFPATCPFCTKYVVITAKMQGDCKLEKKEKGPLTSTCNCTFTKCDTCTPKLVRQRRQQKTNRPMKWMCICFGGGHYFPVASSSTPRVRAGKKRAIGTGGQPTALESNERFLEATHPGLVGAVQSVASQTALDVTFPEIAALADRVATLENARVADGAGAGMFPCPSTRGMVAHGANSGQEHWKSRACLHSLQQEILRMENVCQKLCWGS